MIDLSIFWTWLGILVLIFSPELVEMIAAIWRRDQ